MSSRSSPRRDRDHRNESPRCTGTGTGTASPRLINGNDNGSTTTSTLTSTSAAAPIIPPSPAMSTASPSSVEVSKDFIPGSLVESHFDLSLTQSPPLGGIPAPLTKSTASPSKPTSSSTSTSTSKPTSTSTSTSSEDFRTTVKVIGSEVVREDKPYVHYIMSVSCGGLITWRVCRRYRDFEKLHEKLRAEFGRDTVPQLPKKSMNRTFKQSYIDEMTAGLNIYMRDLLLDHQIGRSPRVCAFLVDSFDSMFSSFLDTQRQQQQHLHDITSSQQERDRLSTDFESYKTRTCQEMNELQQHVKEMTTKYEEMMTQKMRWEEMEAQQSYTIKSLQHAADASATYQQQVSDLQSQVNQLHGKVHTLNHAMDEATALITKLKAEKKVLVRELKEQMKKAATIASQAETRTEEEADDIHQDSPSIRSQSQSQSETTTSSSPVITTSTPVVITAGSSASSSTSSSSSSSSSTSTSTSSTTASTSTSNSSPQTQTSRSINDLSSIDRWILKLAQPNLEPHVS